MKTNSSFARLVFVLALIATIIGLTAFSQTPDSLSFQKEQQEKEKKSSPNNVYKERDRSNLDDLDIDLKQLDLKIDRLTQEIENMDFSKMQKGIDKAMKKIDQKKLATEMERSFHQEDFSRLQKQIDKKREFLNGETMAMLEKKFERVHDNFEKKQFTFPDIDTKKFRLQTERAMQKAKQSLKNANSSLKKMEAFTENLQADGLIDKLKPYKIEVKGGNIYINGVKQSKAVYDKYKQYYDSSEFNITGGENSEPWI